jgi:hypothetical protein
MSFKIRVFMMMVGVLLLAGCAANSTNSPSKPTVTNPQAGKAAVTGRILSVSTGKPFVEEYVFLAGVSYNDKGEGAYFLDTSRSPGTKSDQEGYFQINNLNPGDYVLTVGDPMGHSMVLTDKTSGAPKIWKLQGDKVMDLGDLRFELSN